MTDGSRPSKTDVRTLASVGGDGSGVTVGHVDTPKGERLELESPGGKSIRLDAVALECLTWQDRERFEALFGSLDGDAGEVRPVVATENAGSGTGLATITNEFAHVEVRKVAASDGEGLELVAPKAGTAVTLTAPGLERVAVQSQATITDLVRRRVE